MSTQDKEAFLARWSRRKLESSKEETTAPKPAASAPASPAPAKSELPPLDSLQGLASEYREFLRPDVDERLRAAALKKLFQDPHFRVMDGLDVYMDDYTRPDPIPEATLRALERANRLLFPAANKETPAAEENPDSGSMRAGPDAKPGETNAVAEDPGPKGKTA